MDKIYYLEIDLFCIIILLIIYSNLNTVKGKSPEQKYFENIILWTGILSLSDLIVGVIHNGTSAFIAFVLWLFNILYIVATPVIAYYWLLYAFIKIDGKEKDTPKWQRILSFIPAFIMIALTCATYWNGNIFYLDSNYIYHRGPYIWIHWVITWLYMLFPTFIATKKMLGSKNKIYRRRLYPIIMFVVFPAIGSLFQILRYGLTGVQIGIVISLILVTLRLQNAQISLDGLTGLNNRGHLNRFLESKLSSIDKDDFICLLMIDVNHFKKINDTYGHLVGDRALIDVSDALKKVCGKSKGNNFIARYGGDEFVVFGYDTNEKNVETIIEDLHNELEEKNKYNKIYQLSFSIGCAKGKRGDYKSIDELLLEADVAMYNSKKQSSK